MVYWVKSANFETSERAGEELWLVLHFYTYTVLVSTPNYDMDDCILNIQSYSIGGLFFLAFFSKNRYHQQRTRCTPKMARDPRTRIMIKVQQAPPYEWQIHLVHHDTILSQRRTRAYTKQTANNKRNPFFVKIKSVRKRAVTPKAGYIRPKGWAWQMWISIVSPCILALAI